MSVLPPSAPISGSSTSNSGGGGDQSYQSTPARVVNLPSGLQNLQQNVLLGARLVGANQDGSVVLRTARGDITLNVPTGIPPNAQLQVQLQPGNPPSAVLILTGGEQGQQAVKAPSLQVPTPGAPVITTTTNPLTAPPAQPQNLQQQLPELKLNVIVRALVMEALQTIAAQPNASSLGALVNKPEVLANMLEQLAIKAGVTPQTAQAELLSQLGTPGKLPTQVGQLSLSPKLLETVQQTIQLLQQQPGGVKGLSNDQAALLQLLQASQGSNASAAAATRAAPLIISQLFPGTEMNLKLVQIIPPIPGTQTPTPVTVLPGGNSLTLSGQITPQTVNGQPVMQTAQGSILLQASGKIPVGTTLVFELVQNTPGAATALAPQTAAEMIKTNSPLPKLEQALMMMGQIDKEMFQTLMNTMPKLNGQLPVTALFFMQALRTGEIRNWLGDRALQALRRSGSEGAALVEELAKEFGKISTKSKTAAAGEWRQITLPYLGEQGLSAMRFAVRDHFQPVEEDVGGKKQQDANDPSRVTRFLFDIEFSELGPMQVDGLMRPGSDQNKQLDIVLRTRELLPSEMRRTLRELFSESLGAYGMHGGLSFQAGYQNWIKLAEERSNSARI